ncbi:glycerophosphodiester phosphodiesterase family protein [Howardella ureilytica]
MINRTDKKTFFKFKKCIPTILRYQILTKAFLLLVDLAFRYARGGILWTSDRAVISSGDIPFLFTSVQGWGIMLIGLVILSVYMVFDVNAMIILSNKILHNKPVRTLEVVKEAFLSLKYFNNPFGFFMLMYMAFILPLAGVGLNAISLTENLYLPNFIVSFIHQNILFTILYYFGVLLAFVFTVFNIFTFHCLIIGKEATASAREHAAELIKKNWNNFVWTYFKFILKSVLVVLIIAGVIVGAAAFAVFVVKIDDNDAYRAFLTFMSYLVLSVAGIFILIFVPMHYLTLTKMYDLYTGEYEEMYLSTRRDYAYMYIASGIFSVFLLFSSIFTSGNFDEEFPKVANTKIIAHRAGGNLGDENTVQGLNKAIEKGVWGGEVDVQRTKDNKYIINHDDTFKRLTGNKKTSSELTLEEIKKLEVKNSLHSEESGQIASLEEMLDAAKGKIVLYIELKGKTADEKTADDIYGIVKNKGMLNQVVFVGFNYKLMKYMEEKHPNAETGYLCYAAFGEIENLATDEIIIEEELATPENIDKIKAAGKKVIVWTVNTPMGMARFYSRGADGIITDKIDKSLNIKSLLQSDRIDKYGEAYDDMKRVILHTIFVLWA